MQSSMEGVLISSFVLIGKGELFEEFIESEYPRAILFVIPNVNGARQGIVVDAAHSLFTSRPYHPHFFAEVLSYKTAA